MTAGLCALTSIPAVLYHERGPAYVAVGVLAVVAFLEPALLTAGELTTDANWAPAAVGFSLLPLSLRWSTARAAGVLFAYWIGPAMVAVVRDPGEPIPVALGLSLAGIVMPQMFATLFSSWAFGAAQDARVEHESLTQVVKAEQIAAALQSDYVKRYADVKKSVTPLLRSLSVGNEVTPEIRRLARAESRRMRTLFDQLRADHPLLFEIRALIDAAEDRGVAVSTHFDGDLPPMKQADVDRVVRTADQMIALATDSARVVITATTGEEVTVSLVCEVPEAAVGRAVGEGFADLIWSGRTAWMTIRQPIGASD